jgi:hypothetical protein
MITEKNQIYIKPKNPNKLFGFLVVVPPVLLLALIYFILFEFILFNPFCLLIL